SGSMKAPRAMTVVGICAAFVLAGGAAELVFFPRRLTVPEMRLRGPARQPLSQPEMEALLAKVAKTLDPALRAKLAEAVLTESVRAGYDPLFVLGLVSVESSLRLSTSSERGPTGLTQPM